MESEEIWFLVGKDGRKHNLPHRMIFIGREECEINLQAVNADKRHAVVCFNSEHKRYQIKDLNSLTGTYVNGNRISEQTYVKLKHLDCIRFGYGPDVFYLEKSTSVHQNCSEINSDTKKNACKNDNKLALTNNPTTQKPEIPTFTNRTDLPPDSLPLAFSTNCGTRQPWSDADENLSDSPDYSQRSESSSFSAPINSVTGNDHDASSTHSSPAAMAFTVAFENEIVTPRKKLGIRDSIKKFAPAKLEFDNRNSSTQKNSKNAEPLNPRVSVPTLGHSDKLQTKPAQEKQSTATERKGSHTSANGKDATSFLIKKMLKTEGPVITCENIVRNCRETPANDINDDRSEAGTYTVEAENNDCDVEEARKKIDEVFGVTHLSDTPLRLGKQIPCLNSQLIKQNMKNHLAARQRGPHLNNSQPDTNSVWPRGSRNQYGRTRQLIPTISNSENMSNSDVPKVECGSLQRHKKINEVPPTPDKSRHLKVAISPKSPGKPKLLSTLKSPVTRTNNLSALPNDKNASSGDDVPHSKSSDNRSEGSKSPHTGSTQWRKVPWNLSGSDAELDQSKSENNSVISDTSTEPSSHSSHSGKLKTDHGPQMRLNRAFALRRARLEADTAKRSKENKTVTCSQKAMKRSGKLSTSTITLREASNGKNFRLSPALTNPKPPFSTAMKPIAKTGELKPDQFRKKPEIRTGHRRMDSDPGKGIPIWKNDLRPSTAGAIDNFTEIATNSFEKSPLTFAPLQLERLQSFHRSMSCSIMNDSDAPHPIAPSSLLRSFHQNEMTSSQIVTGPISDEYHCKKHPNRELTALDSLVISAIHQLSAKLWTNSKSLLEKEREKCRKDSDCWLMIEEVLPSVPVMETPEDGDLTKDLSNILKNLKRVEQGLEVLSCVLDSDNSEERNIEKKTATSLPQNFFIVDM